MKRELDPFPFFFTILWANSTCDQMHLHPQVNTVDLAGFLANRKYLHLKLQPIFDTKAELSTDKIQHVCTSNHIHL